MNSRSRNEARSSTSVFKAAITASVLTTVLTNPLDVAKFNMQFFPLSCPYYPHKSYRQLFACGCTKFSFEGSISSLKYAIPQSLIGNMIFMQLYEPTRALLAPYSKAGGVDSVMLASTLARVVVTTMNIPLEALRVKISNRVKSTKRLSFEGYRITLAHDVAFSSIFWAGFETTRNLMSQGDYRQHAKSTSEFSSKNFLLNMLPGFICGSVTSALTTPLDTLKTRVQSQGIKEYSIGGGLKEIYLKEGMIGLFSGVEWRVVRSGSVNAIYMLVYEYIMRRVSPKDQQMVGMLDEL